MDLVNIRIGFQQRGKLGFSEVMDFRIFNLLLQMTHYWSGENNITYGTKPDYQEFNHLNQVLEKEQQGKPVFRIVFVFGSECNRTPVTLTELGFKQCNILFIHI